MNDIWVEGKNKKIIKRTNNIYSLKFNANINPFIAGQYGILKINVLGKYFKRLYSYINNPKNKNLEFYIKKSNNLNINNILLDNEFNNYIYISKKSYGSLISNNLYSGRILWMLSTGISIGPFISILKYNFNIFNKFKKIILINSVSFKKDLFYLKKINNFLNKNKNKFNLIITITKEKYKNYLNNRIPILIKNKDIENKIGFSIDLNSDFIMICGNKNMIKDTINSLYEIKKINKINFYKKRIIYENFNFLKNLYE